MMNRLLTVFHNFRKGICLCIYNVFVLLVLYALFSVDVCVRWASKKAGGSSNNGRKSAGKRLGLKCGDGKKDM